MTDAIRNAFAVVFQASEQAKLTGVERDAVRAAAKQVMDALTPPPVPATPVETPTP